MNLKNILIGASVMTAAATSVNTGTVKRGGSYYKVELTKKQRKARAKAKRARKARKINR